MNIAANMRRLRLRDGLTQEEFARYIGCSAQAVSRWERGDGFPEITLLPAIVNFFNVTLDELFGMEQQKKAAKLEEIEREYNLIFANSSRGSSQGAIAYLKSVLPEYPNAFSLRLSLAQLLGGLMIHGESPTDEQKREAVTIFESITERCGDEHIRNSALFGMATVLQSIGEQEKAEQIVDMLPNDSLMLKQHAAAIICRTA